MLVAAAVCPAGPVLVPDVAQGAAGELAACRAACHLAIGAVLAERPDVLVVVGAGQLTRPHPPGTLGSLEPVGVPVSVRLGRGSPSDADVAVLPLSLTIGAWLLSQHASADASSADSGSTVIGMEVAVDEPVEACVRRGRDIAAEARRVGLLVMADGTARRGSTAPGYTDDRAAGVDLAWTSALADGDPQALADLDPVVADELMMAGRAPLQVLAGAADGGRWRAELAWSGDPYGVQYTVAWWLSGRA